MSEESQPAVTDLDKPFRLGACDVNPMTGEVSNGELTTMLQPQAMEVLRYLAARPGEVVSRQGIEDAVWSDRTVGYDALTGTMFKLRKALGDDPKKPQVIETLSKRGYRLLVPPQPISIATPTCGARAVWLPPYAATKNLLTRPFLAVAAAVLVVTIAVSAWYLIDQQPAKPPLTLAKNARAVVILPFKNLSDSEDSGIVANGLTEDLTTAVAKVPGLTVIARDSAVVYKGEPASLSELAQRLNVNFVVRGSVRHVGERVRINIQLIDVNSGKHVWADQLDGRLREIYDLQEQIVRKLTSTLSGDAGPNGIQKQLVARTKSTEAYRAFQLGRQHFYLYINRRENAKARKLFAEALHHDAQFAMAHAMLAWTHAFDAMNGWTQDRNASLNAAFTVAQKAISLNPELPLSYFVTGLVHREQGEYVKAMVEAEKAIARDANYANAHVLLATLLYYAGRPAESVERLKKAMRLNPHHPFNYSFHLGQAYFTLKRYDDAIDTLQQGVSSNPASERLHIWLAASFAHAGKLEDARWEAAQVKVLNPQFSISGIAGAYPFKSDDDRKHFIAGLKKAGLS